MVGTSSKKPTTSTEDDKTPGNVTTPSVKEQDTTKETVSTKEDDVPAQAQRTLEETRDPVLDSERNLTETKSDTVTEKNSSAKNPTAPRDDNANQVIHEEPEVRESIAQSGIGRPVPSDDSDIEVLHEGPTANYYAGALLEEETEDIGAASKAILERKGTPYRILEVILSSDSDIEVLNEQSPSEDSNEQFLHEGQEPDSNEQFLHEGQEPGSNEQFLHEGQAPDSNEQFLHEGQAPGSNEHFLHEGQASGSNEQFLHEGQAAASNLHQLSPPSEYINAQASQERREEPPLNVINFERAGQARPYYIRPATSEIKVVHVDQEEPDDSSDDEYVPFILEPAPEGACGPPVYYETAQERARKQRYAAYMNNLPEINPMNILKGTGGRRNQTIVPANARRPNYRSLTQRMVMDDRKEIVDVTKEKKQKKNRFRRKYDDDTPEDDDGSGSDSVEDEFKPPKRDSPSPDLQFHLEL